MRSFPPALPKYKLSSSPNRLKRTSKAKRALSTSRLVDATDKLRAQQPLPNRETPCNCTGAARSRSTIRNRAKAIPPGEAAEKAFNSSLVHTTAALHSGMATGLPRSLMFTTRWRE